jgi:hypothetical protein
LLFRSRARRNISVTIYRGLIVRWFRSHIRYVKQSIIYSDFENYWSWSRKACYMDQAPMYDIILCSNRRREQRSQQICTASTFLYIMICDCILIAHYSLSSTLIRFTLYHIFVIFCFRHDNYYGFLIKTFIYLNICVLVWNYENVYSSTAIVLFYHYYYYIFLY